MNLSSSLVKEHRNSSSLPRQLAPPFQSNEFLPAERGRVSRVLRRTCPGSARRPTSAGQLSQHHALETPTGLEATCLWSFPSPAPPVTFVVERVTQRCGGSRKACLKSNSLFLWLASLACFPVSFSPRRRSFTSSRDGGVYGSFSARQAGLREILFWREGARTGYKHYARFRHRFSGGQNSHGSRGARKSRPCLNLRPIGASGVSNR